jgi:hypothetical protein
VSIKIHIKEDMHMDKRINKLICLGLIPVAAVALLVASHPEGLYQRISLLMLTTASMEAATNGGAVGEHLPPPLTQTAAQPLDQNRSSR